MSLPVVALNVTTPIVLSAGVISENQITLVGGQKYVINVVASGPVGLTIWGPFPNGVVDPTTKKGLGKLATSDTSFTEGWTAPLSGVYLLELTASTGTTTVELNVRPWRTGFGGLVDTVLSWFWRFTNK